MKLIFRLILGLLRSKHGRRTQVGTEIPAFFRVWPTDLDFNGHMTNNRYHRVMDYAAIDLLGSHGILNAMFRNRWRPIVGCSLMSHRKALKIFDPYVVHSRVIYCDDAWSYLSHRIEQDGRVIAAGNRKYAFLGRDGLVGTRKIFAAIGQDFANRPAEVDSIRSWVDAEKTVLRVSGNCREVEQAGVGISLAGLECKKALSQDLLREESRLTENRCLYRNLECARLVGCSSPTED